MHTALDSVLVLLTRFKMKLLVAFCLIGVVLARPEKRYGNPDEWGPYYQGDMRFKGPIPKNGILDESYRWPNGVVAYEWGLTFAASKIPTVQQAMQDYFDLTGGCIQWVERTTETDYVTFVDYDTGCWSYVGKIGGNQELNYPQWCIDQYGSVQHEMYHALGFFHEQSRPDRDSYVIIHYENIEPGTENNFEKYDYDYVGTFGEAYDYGSVMHYSKTAFSIDGSITIETIDPAYQDTIGQRVGLSQSDLNKLMNMYNCP